MTNKLKALFCATAVILSLSACSWSEEPEAISGTPPVLVDVAPEALRPSESFIYNSKLSLADSFEQLSSLRLTICDSIYSAVAMFVDDSAWVPVAANNYTLGSKEFLAASYVAEDEPGITAKKILEEDGFENIEVSTLDGANSWAIKAIREEGPVTNAYDYTVMYRPEADSYRFTLKINNVPTMMLSSMRVSGGYAVQVWTPDGTYNILANDTKEGRFGFVPKQESDLKDFPSDDIYFNADLVTSTFTTKGTEYSFLLANNIVYISHGGFNYAVPLP